MNLNSSLSHRSKEPEDNVLYIVGTPIGNLYDFSLRAIEILKNVSFIACEDTRQTKKIMNKFKISNNLLSFNKENSFKKIPRLLNDLKEGKSVALVSDAGMPIICDPGEELVRQARLQGVDVICIPGPCAVTTALVTSGMPSSSFIFEGFLPKKRKEREQILLEISKNVKTTILFESPHRLKKLLKELKQYCGGERQIQVSRELTKIYEEHIGHNIDEVLKFFNQKEILGEITVVIKGINKRNNSEFDEMLLREELYDLIKAGLSLSAASRYLAKKMNLAKNVIYNLH
jgi:16S rRNA (cytidine1402-2'-O)-methyltransferase